MAITYKVRLKVEGKLLPMTIRTVTGDGIVTDSSGLFLRFFTLEDGRLVHIRHHSILWIKYGKERELVVAKAMSANAGQQITKKD